MQKKPDIILFTLFISLVMIFTLAGCQPADTGATQPDNAAPASAATGKPAQAAASAGSYVVALDVNPSIELTVVNGVVTKATAYNDDASQLLLSVDVTGLSAADATKKLVDALAAQGYINNTEIKPYLLISVYDAENSEKDVAEGLKEVASDALHTLDISCSVATTDVASGIPEKAQTLGVSIGRYILFSRIADKEKITVEEASAKYASLKVSELMRLYDGMDEAFDENKDSDEDKPDTGVKLSPEQQAALSAALTKYHAEIKTAEETYVKAKREAISQLKTKWAELKAQYKDNKKSAEFKQAKDALKTAYKATRKQIHDAFRLAVLAAQSEFKSAVSGLGLTDEQLKDLLDYEVGENFKDDSDEYLSDESKDENDKQGSQGENSDKQGDDNEGDEDHAAGGSQHHDGQHSDGRTASGGSQDEGGHDEGDD